MDSIQRINTIFKLVIFSTLCYVIGGQYNQTSTLGVTLITDSSTLINGSETQSNATQTRVNNQTTDILYELRRVRPTTWTIPTKTRKQRATMQKTKPFKKTTIIPTTVPYRPPISYSFANTIFIPQIERNETLKKVKKYFNFKYGIPAAFQDFYIWYYGVKQDKEARDRRMAVTESSYTPGYYTRMDVMHHTVFHVPTDFWDYYIAVNDLAGRTTDPTPVTLPAYLTFAPTPSPITTRATYGTYNVPNNLDASLLEIKSLVDLIQENETYAENTTLIMSLFNRLMAREI